MTREEFEKFKENYNIKKWNCDLDKLLKDAEQISVKRNFKEQFEKAEMNNIIKFVKDYGNFSFERTEKKSGDIIEFHFMPMSSCIYWKDFKQIAFDIGYVSNLSGDIEYFFMLEDGSFYKENRKKIADNTADFLDYITTVEYDYINSLSENAKNIFVYFGWHEGRKIDISKLIKDCENENIYLTESQKRFIEEFGGIDGEDKYGIYFYIENQKRNLWFANILDYCDKVSCFSVSDEQKYELCSNYGKNTVFIGSYLYPVPCDILLAENGQLLCNSHDNIELLGRTAIEGLNILFG